MEIEDSRVKLYRLHTIMLENRSLRRLVIASSGQFTLFQKDLDTTEVTSRDVILKKSRVYRALIGESLEELNASKSEDGDSLEAKDMLSKIHVLWHLCEILYIDILAPGFLVDQLLVWIRYQYPDITVDAHAMMLTKSVHNHPDYWTLLMKFVARGEVKMASNLLKLHPQFESNENFYLIQTLMDKMPQFTRDSIKYEFFAKWQAWNVQCKSHFKKNVFTSPEERIILGLLCGDFLTFSSNKHLFESWYHLMVAFLHFADPLIAEMDVPSLAHQSLTTFLDIRSEHQATSFDRALLSAFSYDLMAVVQESCSFQDNWWFLTHFLDLLYHGGILNTNEIEEPKKLKEFFLLDYADSLMGDSELWSCAVDYFAFCPELGLESLRLHLQRIPLDSEETAFKIIAYSEQYHFDDVTRIVSLVIANKALAKNDLGQAITWSARSKSPVLASHIADIYLKHFVEKHEFPDEEALKSLGNLMLTSDRLTFLAKYYEFVELKKQGSLQEAGVQLESLIASKIAPSFFILTLLMDAIPLLDADMLTLNGDQTFQILMALDSYLTLLNKQSIDEDLKDKENSLRLAIARNMARSMVYAS